MYFDLLFPVAGFVIPFSSSFRLETGNKIWLLYKPWFIFDNTRSDADPGKQLFYTDEWLLRRIIFRYT